MSDLFSIGYSGVRAYQSALGTASENIANANTPGYTRRTAVLSEVPGLGTFNSINLAGNGVTLNGLSRSTDQFRMADVRTAGADLARTETGMVWLERIEGALTGNRLDERMAAFFNAAQGVAADPSAIAPRTVMIEAATTLANAFTGTGQAIDTAIDNMTASGTDAATRLTDLSAGLARVNTSLIRITPGSTEQMQALDERDRLLQSMSSLVDISVDTDAYGRATVRAGGATGPVIADHDGSAYVAFTANTSGGVAFLAQRGGASDVIPAHGGAFAGIADGAARLSGVRGVLDDIATRFRTTVNTAQGNGRTLDNVAGDPLFAAGAKPTDLSVVMTAPRGIAAAAIGEGARGNGNLAALASARTTGKFESGVTDLVTANAAALSARSDVASAQGAIRDAAVAAASAVSGIDVDEEAVNLIRFQQAYQASSRVIQVARDILQTILDIR